METEGVPIVDSAEDRSVADLQRATDRILCGACGNTTNVTTGAEANCVWCGFPIAGEGADRLREILFQVGRIDSEREALLDEYWSIVTPFRVAQRQEQAVKASAFSASQGGTPYYPPPGNGAPHSGPGIRGAWSDPQFQHGWAEWKPEHIRDIFLWLGGILLALAAVVFAGYAFTRMGIVGKAAILGATVLVSYAVSLASRKRLPVTAEVFGALTQVLVLIDWGIIRRGGIGHVVSAPLWWGIGLAIACILGLSLGIANISAGKYGGVTLGEASIPFLVQPLAGHYSTAVISSFAFTGMATVYTVIAIYLLRSGEWRSEGIISSAGARVAGIVAALAAVEGVIHATSTGTLMVASLAILATALPVALAVVFFGNLPGGRSAGYVSKDLMLGYVVATVIGAILAAGARSFSIEVIGLEALAFGSIYVISAIYLPSWLRRPVALVGVLGMLSGFIGSLRVIFFATALPFAWWGKAWQGNLSLVATTHLGPSHQLPRYGTIAIVSIVMVALCVVAHTYLPGDAKRIIKIAQGEVVLGILVLLLMFVAPMQAGATIGEVCIADGVLASMLSAAAIWVWWILHETTIPVRDETSQDGMSQDVYSYRDGRTLDETALPRQGRIARRRYLPTLLAIMGTSIFLNAIAWGSVTRLATLALLSLGLFWLVAGFMAISPKNDILGSAIALVAMAEAGLASAAAGGTIHEDAFSVIAAGVLVLGGSVLINPPTLPCRITLESVAIAGIAVGSMIAFFHPNTILLGAGFALCVPGFVVASIRGDRIQYYFLAVLAVIFAMWSWLAYGGIHLLEAYSDSFVLASLPMGWLSRNVLFKPAGAGGVPAGADGVPERRDGVPAGLPDSSQPVYMWPQVITSWLAYTPGILAMLGPTLFLGMRYHEPVRLGVAASLALVILLAGAWFRLQAPVVFGAIALLMVGIDASAPSLRHIPGWIPLAVAGALLVWIGITAEKRLAQIRSISAVFRTWG